LPEDTSLRIDAATHSQQPLLTVYTWPDLSVSNAILMKFDLSKVPSGAVVEEATLYLALIQSDTSEETYLVTAHKVLAGNVSIPNASGYSADGVAPWTPSLCCNGVPLAQADISPPYDSRTIDKAPGFKAWTLTTMAQEWLANPVANSGVLLNADMTTLRDRYRYFASAEHPDASLRPFLQIVFSAPDATPPAVAVTAPAGGATVSSTVPLVAAAGDNGGVAAVQFEVDGTPFGSALTAAPYVLDWNSKSVSDGEHTLAAVARDWAGNTARSAEVRVATRNGVLILPADDTSLNIDTTNYSRHAMLMTYTWPDNKAANAIVMKFDLSALPADGGQRGAASGAAKQRPRGGELRNPGSQSAGKESAHREGKRSHG
jgi:hypothetical protein